MSEANLRRAVMDLLRLNSKVILLERPRYDFRSRRAFNPTRWKRDAHLMIWRSEPGRIGPPGIPDLCGVWLPSARADLIGRALFLELKTAKGKLSDQQAAFKLTLRDMGYWIVRTPEQAAWVLRECGC